jgi:hypothetical protein
MTMMTRLLFYGWMAAVAALFAGCVTDSTRVSVSAVGPLNGTPPGSLGSGQGTLKVFTQNEPWNDGGASSVGALCSIYSEAGRLVERFRNASINEDAPPHEIKLTAGRYLVSVPTPGYGQVTVPVVIVVNEVTPLYLDRSGMGNKDALPESELSRLPDGRIAGRAAYPPPPPAPKEAGEEKSKP